MAGYVATIGMFDGVHLGHQFVISQVVQTAAERGLQSMAITFDHSLHREQVLTPLAVKRKLLYKAGIDRVEVLSFTDELRQMTAREFMQQVLKERLDVKVLLTGYDNRFGHNREETFEDYVRYGQELGIDVRSLPPAPAKAKGRQVSSSLVRELLTQGRVADAAKNLGYPYMMMGHVAHGEHVGTLLGYPTANLVPDDSCQLIPAAGAYAVTVRLEHSQEERHGMMNIGMRPTFDGCQQTLEVHIFQWHEDLYGQTLQVSFVEYLREECRFDSTEALKSQLKHDAGVAEEILRLNEKKRNERNEE